MPDTTDLIRRARELAGTLRDMRHRAGPSNEMELWRMFNEHVRAAGESSEMIIQLIRELERLSGNWRDRCYQEMLAARGIDSPDDACPRCKGTGVRLYPDTTTWRGGVGGQIVTKDVCDECWGSGDRNVKWADLRKLEAELARLKGGTFYECPDCGATCMGRDLP